MEDSDIIIVSGDAGEPKANRLGCLLGCLTLCLMAIICSGTICVIRWMFA